MEAGLGRGGIDDGFGRGPPPPAAGGRCWPPWMPNGLLPAPRAGGRPPGRAPGPGAGAPGRPAAGEPGRGGIALGPAPGAGRGPGRGPPSVGGSRRTFSRCCWRAAWAALTAASCSAFSAAARASAAATSMSWALAGLATGVAGCGGPGSGPLGFAPGAGAWPGRRGGIGLAETRGAPGVGDGDGDGVGVDVGAATCGAAGAGAPVEATNALRSRRATGASTVLDADFTNSPISFNLARTVLLSTPSSLASSCTRALPATALLTPRSCGQYPQRPHSCT